MIERRGMNPEYKRKWVEALRSGKYTQTTAGCLNDGDGFCCLGVLCDVVKAELGLEWVRNSSTERWVLVGPGGVESDTDKNGLPIEPGGLLPVKVCNLVGLVYSPDPYVLIEKSLFTLSNLNDELGYTFNQIADLVESQL